MEAGQGHKRTTPPSTSVQMFLRLGMPTSITKSVGTLFLVEMTHEVNFGGMKGSNCTKICRIFLHLRLTTNFFQRFELI